MSIMFFLPNILLSGFMFPFAGMPVWAQYIGEALPLTHYLRIVRSIMLKGSTLADLHYDTAMLFVLMLVAMAIAMTRFRRTLRQLDYRRVSARRCVRRDRLRWSGVAWRYPSARTGPLESAGPAVLYTCADTPLPVGIVAERQRFGADIKIVEMRASHWRRGPSGRSPMVANDRPALAIVPMSAPPEIQSLNRRLACVTARAVARRRPD